MVAISSARWFSYTDSRASLVVFVLSYKSNNASAALCHTVNLGKFYVKSCADSGFSYNSAGKERALTANAYYHNIHICNHSFLAVSLSLCYLFDSTELTVIHAKSAAVAHCFVNADSAIG